MNTKNEIEGTTEDKPNYRFLLECMAGLSGVLVTAGIITVIALKASAAIAVTGLMIGAATFSPVLSFFIMGAIILAFFLLPALMAGGCYAATTPHYRSSSFWNRSYVDDITHHSHSNGFFDGSTVVHNHPSSSGHNHNHEHHHGHPSTHDFEHVHNHPSSSSDNHEHNHSHPSTYGSEYVHNHVRF